MSLSTLMRLFTRSKRYVCRWREGFPARQAEKMSETDRRQLQVTTEHFP